MNTIIHKQLDSRWSSKPYPTAKSSFGGNGCGCCACTHIAMEQSNKANWTPENLRQWMINQGFAYVNQGTTWQGITATLEYIGHKNVVRVWNDPMSVAFAELEKGNRIGVFLFSAGYGGSEKIYWTSGGHYVAFTDSKYENDDWWFYCKDSGGRNHDGWYSYKKHMKGVVAKVWIVERLEAPSPTPTPQIDVDGKWGTECTKYSQQILGTTADGIISSQSTACRKYLPNALTSSWKFVSAPKGSAFIKALQKLVGAKVDGVCGQGTIKEMQEWLWNRRLYSGTFDGVMGAETVKAWQTYVNKKLKGEDVPYNPPQKEQTANEKAISATTSFARQMVKDGVYYKKWTSDTKTHQCYVCHPNSGKGVNCIGVPSMAFKHGGGANVKCSMDGLLNDAWANKLYAKKTDAERQAFWRSRNGNDWNLVKSPSEGCVGVCYQKGNYKHTIYCSSATTIIDSTSGQKGVKERKLSALSSYTKIYFKYTGKGKF